MISSSSEERLSVEIGALLIKRIAPDEEQFYVEIVETYRAETKASRKTAEQPLAFGVGEIVGVMSPLIYEAGKMVVSYVIDLAKDTAVDALAKEVIEPRLSDWVRSRFSNPAPIGFELSMLDGLVDDVRMKLGDRGVEPVIKEKIVEAIRDLLRQAPPPCGKVRMHMTLTGRPSPQASEKDFSYYC